MNKPTTLLFKRSGVHPITLSIVAIAAVFVGYAFYLISFGASESITAAGCQALQQERQWTIIQGQCTSASGVALRITN